MVKTKEISKTIPFEELIKKQPEEVAQYVFDNLKELSSLYQDDEIHALTSRINENIYEGKANPPNVPFSPEIHRRQSWYVNHIHIISAIHTTITDEGRMPTTNEIAVKTKLSRQTIMKHLKHFEKEEYLNYHLQKWKIVTEKLMTEIYSMACKADKLSIRLKAADLYLKYFDKLIPKGDTTNSNKINSYIQINNIYITQDTIKALPEKQRSSIEHILITANATKL